MYQQRMNEPPVLGLTQEQQNQEAFAVSNLLGETRPYTLAWMYDVLHPYVLTEKGKALVADHMRKHKRDKDNV